jgi:hypothetical protein
MRKLVQAIMEKLLKKCFNLLYSIFFGINNTLYYLNSIYFLQVLLIVDNCAAHPKLTGLKSITLAFFPPNTTSVLQPCDQGIIYNFKCKYRQRMVEHIIDVSKL